MMDEIEARNVACRVRLFKLGVSWTTRWYWDGGSVQHRNYRTGKGAAGQEVEIRHGHLRWCKRFSNLEMDALKVDFVDEMLREAERMIDRGEF